MTILSLLTTELFRYLPYTGEHVFLVTHRFEEATDLDVYFAAMHEAWQSSGNRLKLVHAVKQCFKQILQLSLADLSVLALSAMHQQLG